MKLVKFLVVTMMLISMVTLAGCGGGDKISGTYYSQILNDSSLGTYGNYVEEMTITKEGNNYYMTGRKWFYNCDIDGEKLIANYDKSIPKQQLKVDGNNIMINRAILGPATLSLHDEKLEGEEFFGNQTSFEKSPEVFKKNMAALLEKYKEYYDKYGHKGSTPKVDNSKLDEALKAK